MAHPSRGFSESIGIWKCWFLRRGENRSTRRKTSQSKDENQQQTQPTYDAESRNRTQATLVGGKCSTTAPSLLPRRWVKNNNLPGNKYYYISTSLFGRDQGPIQCRFLYFSVTGARYCPELLIFPWMEPCSFPVDYLHGSLEEHL